VKEAKDSFERLYGIVRRLRAPDGCPWDREQSPETLRGSIIEEAYECVEAIDEKKPAHVKEELGDLFLLATMVAYMHEQSGDFSVSDSLEDISEKLIRRHPHVFGESEADTPEKVLKQWDDIKVNVEGRNKKDSILDEVSRAFPPLERAYKIQKKAAKVGFDWNKVEDVWGKVDEEIREVKAACGDAGAAESRERIEEEVGDLLFAVVNISRFLGMDPTLALHKAIGKFTSRFREVESEMAKLGKKMDKDSFELMDSLWDKAKAKGL
jgi:tetrapyrrole methylase family protein / MazG family protein